MAVGIRQHDRDAEHTSIRFCSQMMQILLSLTLSCEVCDCVPFSWQILIIDRPGHDKLRLIVFWTVESKLLCLRDREVDGL